MKRFNLNILCVIVLLTLIVGCGEKSNKNGNIVEGESKSNAVNLDGASNSIGSKTNGVKKDESGVKEVQRDSDITKDIVIPYVEYHGIVVSLESTGVVAKLKVAINESNEKEFELDRNTIVFDEEQERVISSESLVIDKSIRVFARQDNHMSKEYAEVILIGNKFNFIKVGKVEEIDGDISFINKFGDTRLVLLNGCEVLSSLLGEVYDPLDIQLSDTLIYTKNATSEIVVDGDVVKTEFDDNILVDTTLKVYVKQGEK